MYRGADHGRRSIDSERDVYRVAVCAGTEIGGGGGEFVAAQNDSGEDMDHIEAGLGLFEELGGLGEGDFFGC